MYQLKKIPSKIYLWGFLILVGLGVVFYVLLGRQTSSLVTQRILSRQQLLARAEAANISSFFQVFGDSVATFAQLRSVKEESSTALTNMQTFVDQWRDSGLVDGIALIDADGKLKYNANVGTPTKPGVELSDRDYYLWAKSGAKEGEFFIGEPVISRLGASEGKYIVPVASPIYRDGEFVGVVTAAVELFPLTQVNLEMMKVSDSSSVFLIDNEGALLYSNDYPNDVGANFFDLLGFQKFSGSKDLSNTLKQALEASGEGKQRVSYLDPVSGSVKNHLMAYSPVKLNNETWLLIMASPTEEVWSYTVPIYVRITVLIVLMFITAVFFSSLLVRELNTPKN